MSALPSAGSGLRHELRLFFTALQFFTRLPVPRWVGFDAAWLQHATRYFPAVGILVGVVCAIGYWLASLLLPQVVAVLLSTAAGIYLTGAFHEDGFADVCDGFGGGMQASRVLEIMRDSRVGAYGAIGIVLLLGLAATVFLAHKFRRRIGGYTGDCLGAVQQLSEIAIYLGLLAAVSAASSL